MVLTLKIFVLKLLARTEKVRIFVCSLRIRFNHDTVKPEYNDHLRDPKFVTVVDRWSLFIGSLRLLKWNMGRHNSGRCRQVVDSSGLTKAVTKFDYNKEPNEAFTLKI